MDCFCSLCARLSCPLVRKRSCPSCLHYRDDTCGIRCQRHFFYPAAPVFGCRFPYSVLFHPRRLSCFAACAHISAIGFFCFFCRENSIQDFRPLSVYRYLPKEKNERWY